MKNRNSVLNLTTTAMLGALASILMMLEFSTPFMPGFIKFDFSELPGVFAAIAISPVSGVLVCLIKNAVHLIVTTTGGIGEVANFILGAVFVLTTGYIFRFLKEKKFSLVVSGVTGSMAMALVSLPVNYYITYPVYSKMLPIDAIIEMYAELNSSVNSLFEALLVFNVPFNFVKGVICVIIAAVLYKSIKPLFAKFESK
mgnify:FL=1